MGQDRFDRIVNCVFDVVGVAELLAIYVLFSARNIEAMPLSQCPADLCTPQSIVLVGDGFAVVIDPVEDDMTVWMLAVVMPDNDVLGVSNAHFLHILARHQPHKIVANLTRILRRKVERYVPDLATEPGIKQRLRLETVDDRLLILKQNTVGGEQFRICFAHHIADTTAE